MIDLTIACNLKMADGIGRQGIGLLSAIKDDLNLNILPTSSLCDLSDVPEDLQQYFQNNSKPEFGKILFWTYILGLNEAILPLHQNLKSELKIAYSMFESDRIPPLWTRILNSYYDCVVVPDPYLVQVYQDSGVRIPVFVLPLGIFAEQFLTSPAKEQPNEVFTFGMTAGFWERKNHIKLLQAFARAFGQNDKVQLKLHGRFGSYQKQVEAEFAALKLKNAELISKPFSQQEYFDWFSSLDAYVFPSQGEGFSITPREALALGIPCILSANSVHHTLLETGYFVPLKSEIKTPAKYEVFGNQQIGHFYDCSADDLAQAMQEVYYNYEEHLQKTQSGREWVRQFLWPSLRPLYLGLFSPQEIKFGTKNFVTTDFLMTNSPKLLEKLKKAHKK